MQWHELHQLVIRLGCKIQQDKDCGVEEEEVRNVGVVTAGKSYLDQQEIYLHFRFDKSTTANNNLWVAVRQLRKQNAYKCRK